MKNQQVINPRQEREEEKIISKKGIRAGSYNIPWWIIIAIILVIIYIMYDRSTKNATQPAAAPLAKGGSLNFDELNTPDFLREIFDNLN